jgi:hypothetical protein
MKNYCDDDGYDHVYDDDDNDYDDNIIIIINYIAQQPLVNQGFLIIEASRSYSVTPHSVGLLWTSDRPDAENYT